MNCGLMRLHPNTPPPHRPVFEFMDPTQTQIVVVGAGPGADNDDLGLGGVHEFKYGAMGRWGIGVKTHQTAVHRGKRGIPDKLRRNTLERHPKQATLDTRGFDFYNSRSSCYPHPQYPITPASPPLRRTPPAPAPDPP